MPDALHFADILWAELFLLGLALCEDAQPASHQPARVWQRTRAGPGRKGEPPPPDEVDPAVRPATDAPESHRQVCLQQLQRALLERGPALHCGEHVEGWRGVDRGCPGSKVRLLVCSSPPCPSASPRRATRRLADQPQRHLWPQHQKRVPHPRHALHRRGNRVRPEGRKEGRCQQASV